MRVRSILTAFLAIAALGLTALGASPASAQTPEDAHWRLAPRSIFGDDRLILAFSHLLDGTGAGSSLTYGDPAILAQLETIPEEDQLLLLMAAGVIDQQHQILGLVETRTCRVWVGNPELVSLAVAFASEFALVFSSFGLDVTPCELTEDADAADLFVYDSTSVPDIDFSAYTSEGSFLQYAGAGGGKPSPSVTGHGVARHTAAWPAILAGLMALAGVAGARRTVRG